MKITRISAYEPNSKPVLVAKGTAGGCHVNLFYFYSSSNPNYMRIGTKECLENDLAFGYFASNTNHHFFLKEDEALYIAGNQDKSYAISINVTYYNDEQFTSNPTQATPINLSGTIQLNQQ